MRERMEAGKAQTILSNMGQEELKYLEEQGTVKSGHSLSYSGHRADQSSVYLVPFQVEDSNSV